MANLRRSEAPPAPSDSVLNLLSRRILPGSVLLFCTACIVLLSGQGSRIFLLGEAGYGDMYVFHTIRQFQTTGLIYHHGPGEPAALYGPMLYTLLALPGRFLNSDNPMIGPRLIEAAVFLLCIGVVVSITRALIPYRKIWLWSLPLALSFPPMYPWVLQLRGDFMSVLFSLTALRLLLTRRQGLTLLAGASAGFATQFKPNYIAALLAGLFWLAINRRWKKLALFALGSAVTFIGIYTVYNLREPRMAGNMLALRHPLLDFAGGIRLILHVANESIALLGLCALPFLRRQWQSRWTLLAFYSMFAFGIASATVMQIGGASNYFMEFMLSLTPFAALAMLKLQRWRLWNRWTLLLLLTFIALGVSFVTQLPPGAIRNGAALLLLVMATFGALKRSNRAFGVAGLTLSVVLLICLALPVGSLALGTALNASAWTRTRNRELTDFQNAVKSRKVLTFATDLTFFSPTDFVPDPWGASLGERMGVSDLHPMAARILGQEFDLIVTQRISETWRGVDRLSPTFKLAIGEAYQPFCALENWLMFLPRDRAAHEDLRGRLLAMGCDARACLSGPSCRTW
jgi:hypothetical protein